jgi:hypothetical protein
VTLRFPDLRFGFLEGGAAWATALYARLVEHWKKRNHEAIQRLDPARVDQDLLGRLIDEFGHERLKPYRDKVVKAAVLGERMEELDDWRDCKIARPEDIRDLFVASFFFGCEGDDRSAAAAFDRKMNPYGASLNPMLGSDIGSTLRRLGYPSHARLASDGWCNFSARDWLRAGFPTKGFSHPPFPGFAWCTDN